MIYEIAEKAKNAVKNNCDAYEIYVDESNVIELDSKQDELNFAKEEIEQGVGIRIIKDNRIGFAFTSNLDKISQTANQAIENAKLTKQDENYAFAEEEKVVDVKKVYDNKFNDLDLDEGVELLKNVISTATDSGCEVTGSGFSAGFISSLCLSSAFLVCFFASSEAFAFSFTSVLLSSDTSTSPNSASNPFPKPLAFFGAAIYFSSSFFRNSSANSIYATAPVDFGSYCITGIP